MTDLSAMYEVVPAVYADAKLFAVRDLAGVADDPDALVELAQQARTSAPVPLDYLRRRYIRRGAILTAHAVRLRANADELAWAHALDGARRLFSSAQGVKRAEASVRVRRALQATTQQAEADEPGRAVALWLAAGDDDQYIATAAKAARWWRQQLDQTPLLLAWYATYGAHLLQSLTADHVAERGRPSASTAAERARLRHVVRRVWESGMYTKTELAEHAHITRPTLDAWLQSSPDEKGRLSDPTW